MLIINTSDRRSLERECEDRQRMGVCPDGGCWRCDIEQRLHMYDAEMDEHQPKQRRRRWPRDLGRLDN